MTSRGLVSQHASGWVSFSLRWENVERLHDQARQAYAAGLDVAAAVTARMAAEESVRRQCTT